MIHNLIVETAQGKDYLISRKDDSTLIRMAEREEADYCEKGQIRIYKSSVNGDLVIGFLAKQRITADAGKQNIAAVAVIRPSELKILSEIIADVTNTVRQDETDQLRSRIQDLEEEVQGLNLLLKDRSDHLQEALEG